MILALVILGFALIAAGTYRQSEWLLGRVASVKVRLRLLAAGYAALTASLALVVLGPDMARQLVQWFGWLTVGATLILVGFWIHGPRRPRTKRAARTGRRSRRIIRPVPVDPA